jgi:hypothetical protein
MKLSLLPCMTFDLHHSTVVMLVRSYCTKQASETIFNDAEWTVLILHFPCRNVYEN